MVSMPKGGGFRKWYGNNEHCELENNGEKIKEVANKKQWRAWSRE
jgi:hypothetical protein